MGSISVKLSDGTQITINEGDRYADLAKNEKLKKLAPLFDLIDNSGHAAGGDKIVNANELALIEKAIANMQGNIEKYDIDKYCRDFFSSGVNIETFINTHAPVKETVVSQDGKTSQGAFNQYIQNIAQKYDKEALKEEFAQGVTHTVGKGDNLYTIAKRVLEAEGVEPTYKAINERIAQIAVINNIKNVNVIYIGAVIIVGKPATPGGANPPASGGANPPASGGANPPASGGANPPASGGANPPASGGANPPASGGANPPASGGANPPATSSITVSSNGLDASWGRGEDVPDKPGIKKYTKGTGENAETIYTTEVYGVLITGATVEEVEANKKAYEEAVIKNPVANETEDAAKARKAANLQAVLTRIKVTNGNIEVLKEAAETLRMTTDLVDPTSAEYKALVKDLILTRNPEVIRNLLLYGNEAELTVLLHDEEAHRLVAGIYKEIRDKEKAGVRLTETEHKLKEILSSVALHNGAIIEKDGEGNTVVSLSYDKDGNIVYASAVTIDNGENLFGAYDKELVKEFQAKYNEAIKETDETKKKEKLQALYHEYKDKTDPVFVRTVLAFCAYELNASKADILDVIKNNGLEITYFEIGHLPEADQKEVAKAIVDRAKTLFLEDKGNLENTKYLEKLFAWLDTTDMTDEQKDAYKTEVLETYFNVTTDENGNKTYTFTPSRRPTEGEMYTLAGYSEDSMKEALVKSIKLEDMGKGEYNEGAEQALTGTYTVPHYAEMVDKMTTKEEVIDFIDNKVAYDKNYHLPYDKIIEKFGSEPEVMKRLLKHVGSYSTISEASKLAMTKFCMQIDKDGNITFDKSKLPEGVDMDKLLNVLLLKDCKKGDALKCLEAILQSFGKDDLDTIAKLKDRNPELIKAKIKELVQENANDCEFIQKICKLDKSLIPYDTLTSINAIEAAWDDKTRMTVFETTYHGRVLLKDYAEFLDNAVQNHLISQVVIDGKPMADRYSIGDTVYQTNCIYIGEDGKELTDDDRTSYRKVSMTGYQHGVAMFKELEGAGSGDIAKMLRATEEGFEQYVTPDNVTGILTAFQDMSPTEGLMEYIANEWSISAGKKPGKALCNRIPKALMRKAASMKLQDTEEYKALKEFFGADDNFNFTKNDEASERYDADEAKKLDELIYALLEEVTSYSK